MTELTLEGKLDALAACGLRMCPEVSLADLKEIWGEEVLEESGFLRLMVALGENRDRFPWTPHCANLWYFDCECIGGDGSYVEIANRMSAMTQGSMPMENVEDHVDLDAKEAWLRFDCLGRTYRIACRVDEDWCDPDLFVHFVRLLAVCDPRKCFFSYHDVIGCVSWEEYDRLKSLLSTKRLELLR